MPELLARCSVPCAVHCDTSTLALLYDTLDNAPNGLNCFKLCPID
jgi:hypothetical protein